MNDRIKLAEAMGWTKCYSTTHARGKRCTRGYHPDRKPNGQPSSVPDPFTDANDDYAVRDHFVAIGKTVELADALHNLIILRRDPTVTNTNNYGLDIEDAISDLKIGDFARAALKLIS